MIFRIIPVVNEVLPGKPAANAGLRPGDAIIAINGSMVRSPADAASITNAHPGERVTFTLRRDGQDSYRLWVVSHREKEIHVYLDGVTPKAEAVIGGRVSLVEKIYIQMRKSFMLPLPDFGEMFGFDRQTGEKRYEKVTRTE